MKYSVRRWISLFMAAVLVIAGMSTNIYAASGKASEEISFPNARPEVHALPAERLEELAGQEAVYFGAATADLEEGDAYYSFPVYREGALDKEAAVSLLTLDVSALYGADYELLGEDVFVSGNTQTLLEKGNGNNPVMSNEEKQELQDTLNEKAGAGSDSESLIGSLTTSLLGTDPLMRQVDWQAEEADKSAQKAEEADESAQGTEEASEQENESGLGAFSRQFLGDIGMTISDEVDDEAVSEALKASNLDYSAGMVLHFAAGESEKTVVFHVFEDELEEGQEMIQFVLADPEDTEIKSQQTLGVVINDNEQLHKAKISLSAERYSSDNGSVTVTVERSGSSYSMIDFYLCSAEGTAKEGENYTAFSKLLNMQPYQTAASYTFETKGSGRMQVVLQAETGCEVEGIDIATVLIDETKTKEQLNQINDKEKEVDALYQSMGGDESPRLQVVEELTAGNNTEDPEEDGAPTEEEIDAWEEEQKEKDFKITIDGKEYLVKYTGDANTATVGGIYNKAEYESGGPRVGDYIFVTEKTTNYGIYEGYQDATKWSRYEPDTKTFRDSKARLYWFRGDLGNKYQGSSVMKTKNEDPKKTDSFFLGSSYYKNFRPEWAGKAWAGYNQGYEFNVETAQGNQNKAIWARGAFYHDGEFDKCIDNRVKVELPLDWDNQRIVIAAKATDRSWCMPKNDLWVYGFVCMYKSYEVKLSPVGKKEYKSAGGAVLSSVPFGMRLKAGAGKEATYDDYRTVYTDSTGEQSKLTFSPTDIYLNGHSGKFGEITGYEITYNCEKSEEGTFKAVKYPQDFFAYMDQQTKNPSAKHDLIDYSAQAVADRKAKATGDMLTVYFDAYLIDWLTSVELSLKDHKKVFGDEAPKLAFMPIIDYTKITVKVLEPSGEHKGKFTNDELQPGTHTFHAGDTLDLTAEPIGEDVVADGYEVCYDGKGEKWDQITSTSRLFLSRTDREVMIRPLINSVYNKIRIELIGDAAKHISIDGLIDEEDLEDTKYKGMLILDIHPEKGNIYDRARPAIGQSYNISVKLKDKPAEAGYVYRVYFQDPIYKEKGKLYTQSYATTGRVRELDNVISIGVEKVKESELMEITVSGQIKMLPIRFIRDDARSNPEIPVADYSVVTFDKQFKNQDGTELISMAQTITDNNGKYTLSGFRAKKGDVIPLQITGGYGASQTAFVTVGSEASFTADLIKIHYPSTAPEVVSVMYSYKEPLYNLKHDLNQNTIAIYPDTTLDMQITVDNKDRAIEKVIVSIVNYDGVITDYEAAPKAGARPESDIWTVAIDMKKIAGSDRVYIRVVDKQQQTIWTGGKPVKRSIVYPTVDTGLTFYVTFERSVPQWYIAGADNDYPKIDIPLMGTGNSNSSVTSGLISWQTDTWDDGKGYTMSINLSVGLSYPISPMIWAYRQQQFKNMTIAGDIKTELNSLNFLNPQQEKWQLSKIDTLQKQLKANIQASENAGKSMSDPLSQGVEKFMAADASTIINLYFVKDGDSYTYMCGQVVFGFTLMGDFTKFRMILSFPGYVNFGFVFQVGFTGIWSTPAGVKGISASNFRQIQGNLKDVIGSESGWQGSVIINIGFTGYLGVGVGKKDMLSVRGNIEVSVQFAIPKPKDATKKGQIFEFAGGMTFDLFVTQLKFDIGRIMKGWGCYKDKSEITWFGAVKSKKPGEQEEEEEAEEWDKLRSSELIKEDGNETTSYVKTLVGTDDMSLFGAPQNAVTYETEDPDFAYPDTLLEDAADYARIRTVEIDNKGSLFMVFIGNRGKNGTAETEPGNEEALYYTVYQNGSWTTPALLDDDGSFDTEPSLSVRTDINNRSVVTISWSSAERPYKESDTDLQKMGLLRMKMASFTMEDGTPVLTQEPVYLTGSKASPSNAVRKDKTAQEETLEAAGTEETAAETEGAETKTANTEQTETEGTGEEKEAERAQVNLLSGLNDLKNYFDVPVKSWTTEDLVYALYTRYDLSKAGKIEDIMDGTKTKPAVYLAVYDRVKQELTSVTDLKLTGAGSILIGAEAELITIPLMEWDGVEQAEKSFIVISYTQDTGGTLSTETDDDLRLCLVKVISSDSPFVYPSIDVWDGSEKTEAGHSMMNSALTELDGHYYLTWLQDGYRFEMADIGDTLGEMFAFDYLAEFYQNRVKAAGGGDSACFEDGKNSGRWYELTTADIDALNKAWKDAFGQDSKGWMTGLEDYKDSATEPIRIPDPTDPGSFNDDPEKGASTYLLFKDSDVERIAGGKLEPSETVMGSSGSKQTSIGEYQLVSSGGDVYIIYADQPEYRLEPESELFCVKLNTNFGVKNSNAADDADVSSNFSKPVQLTDAERVLEGFSASMEDGEIRIVSESYEQIIPEKGGIVFSPNTIAETRYLPRSILQIEDILTGTRFDFDAQEDGKDYITVSFKASNAGLEAQQGYFVQAFNKAGDLVYEADRATRSLEETSIVMQGDDTDMASYDEEVMTAEETILLESGCSEEFSFSCPVEDHGIGESFKIVLLAADKQTQLDEQTIEIEEVKQLAVAGVRSEYDVESGYKAYITVENTGNVPTDDYQLALNLLGDENEVLKNYGSIGVPSLEPAESQVLEIPYTPEAADFSVSGTLHLQASVEGLENGTWEFYHVAGNPEQLAIEENADRLTVSVGGSRKLKAELVPFAEKTGKLMYTAADPSVVRIDEDGTVHGLKEGMTIVTAYSPEYVVSDSILVAVKYNYVPEDDPGSGGSSKLPSYVDTDGNWQMDANGNWTYTTKAGVKVKDKWLAIAHSTYGNGGGFEWFRFDKDGNMVTGWFRDSDGRTYYLQIVSNGNKGAMLTGWQLIDGNWYYFEPLSTGYRGSMYVNQKTRDGYTVGENGIWTGK